MKKRQSTRQAMGLRELKTLLSQSHDSADGGARSAQATRAQPLRDVELFALSVGPVQPVFARDRANSRVADPVSRRMRTQREDKAALHDAISDGFDAELLLAMGDGVSFRGGDIGDDVVRKLRRGVWAVQAQIDLHGLRRDQARQRLSSFLQRAAAQGLRCVRVIHGKGYGSPDNHSVLRHAVPGWLVQAGRVAAFTQARTSQGGSGALLVLLRR